MPRRRRAFRDAGPPKTRPIPTPPPIALGDPEIAGLTGAVVLVGPMAAGKTSLGKRLARELGVTFIDSDARIQQLHGPITEIFSTHGEEHFRDLEAQVIAAELARKGPRILALGGGAVIRKETRELLKKHPVILLMTTQNAVLKTANIARRPLLKDDPSVWGRILEERRAFYEEVADVTFRTDRYGQRQLTEVAVQWVKEWVNDKNAK